MAKKNYPFSVEQPEESSGFLLWQTTIIWQRQIKKALEPYELSQTQFVILANLCWFETVKQEVTQVTLVNTSKLDKMTVSKALKKLSELKLVSRTEHRYDTRAKSIALTKKGRTLVPELINTVESIDSLFFGVLKKQNQKQLNTLLLQLITNNAKEE